VNVCDDGHDEIQYECEECPVCAMIEEVEQVNKRLEELEGIVDRMREIA
jgi:hypothetical protein